MPIWAICNSRQNQNSLDKIKGQIVSWRIFVSIFASALNFKLSNFVSAWSAHETSWHSLPMDSNSSFRIHRTSFQSSKKVNAFQVNFSREDRSWRERHLVVTQSHFEIAFVKDAVYDDSDYVIHWDTCCIFFRASRLCSVFKFIP